MNMLTRTADRLTQVLSFIGMIGVLAMMVHICADVLGRTVFDISVPATLEMVTRYYMLMLVLLPLAWVEMNRNMIVVEAFSSLFGKLGIRIVDTLVSVVCAGVYVILMKGTWLKAVEQYDVGAYIMALDAQVIIWPGYFVLPISFALAAIVCLIRIPLLFTQKPVPEPA